MIGLYCSVIRSAKINCCFREKRYKYFCCTNDAPLLSLRCLHDYSVYQLNSVFTSLAGSMFALIVMGTRSQKNNKILHRPRPLRGSSSLVWSVGITTMHGRPLSRAAIRFPAGADQIRLARQRAYQNTAGGGAKLFRRRRRNSAPVRKCVHKGPNKVKKTFKLCTPYGLWLI